MTNKSYLNRVRRLGDIPSFVKKAVSEIKYQKRVSDLRKRGAVPLSEIKKDFEKVSWDLFRRTIEPDAGSIWKKETIKNANGEDEDWLVVYTDDQDKIIRKVKASKKTAGGDFDFIDYQDLPNGWTIGARGWWEKPGVIFYMVEAFPTDNQEDYDLLWSSKTIDEDNEGVVNAVETQTRKMFEQYKKEVSKREPPKGFQYKLSKKTSSKTSHSPGTIVQIDVPHGNLYEKYNGKIGEVVAAVPDRSKVSFKDLPSTWFEDNIIRPVSLCPICNAKMSLQMLKKLGTIKCECGASYSKRQLEKIANENRINKVAVEKMKKIAAEIKWDKVREGLYEAVMMEGWVQGFVSKFGEAGNFASAVEGWADINDFVLNPNEVSELVELLKSIQSKETFSSTVNKKAQNIVQTLWVDDPKDLRHYFKSLQSPPTSPAKEPSKGEPEDLEEVDLESEEEEVEKEASIKKKADGMEALRGGGGAGSDKLTPMNWNVKETKYPRLPTKPEEETEPEPTEEEVEEITITVNPDSKAVSVDFGKEEEEETEEETPELKGAEAPTEKTEELETEEVPEEEGTEKGEGSKEPKTPVIF